MQIAKVRFYRNSVLYRFRRENFPASPYFTGFVITFDQKQVFNSGYRPVGEQETELLWKTYSQVLSGRRRDSELLLLMRSWVRNRLFGISKFAVLFECRTICSAHSFTSRRAEPAAQQPCDERAGDSKWVRIMSNAGSIGSNQRSGRNKFVGRLSP
jgi:hypothetical protein